MNPEIDDYLNNAKNWKKEMEQPELKTAFKKLTPG